MHNVFYLRNNNVILTFNWSCYPCSKSTELNCDRASGHSILIKLCLSSTMFTVQMWENSFGSNDSFWRHAFLNHMLFHYCHDKLITFRRVFQNLMKSFQTYVIIPACTFHPTLFFLLRYWWSNSIFSLSDTQRRPLNHALKCNTKSGRKSNLKIIWVSTFLERNLYISAVYSSWNFYGSR